MGATDGNDKQASFSNYGKCLDLYAPGVNILSSSNKSDTATMRMSGTSQATPHVTGAAALLLTALCSARVGLTGVFSGCDECWRPFRMARPSRLALFV